MTEKLEEVAKEAILELMRQLTAHGITADALLDALLTVSIATGINLMGKDATARLLEELATDLRGGPQG
jgi:hypothetical protein